MSDRLLKYRLYDSSTLLKNLVTLLFISVLLVSCDSYDSRQTMRHKDAAKALSPVITAIEKYKSDNHEYPSDLTDLIPKYLQALPNLPPNTGELWYKLPEWYNNASASQTAREYYLTLDINSVDTLQRGEVLCYYPKRWRVSSGYDQRSTPTTGRYRNPIALDDEWVRYRD